MTTYAITALLLIMLPGPDQALITRNALAGGRRAGLLTMLGGVLGLTLHAGAASVGLSALLLASAPAFAALKVVGAAYLLWLGAQAVRSAMRGPAPVTDSPMGRRSAEHGPRPITDSPAARGAWLRQGFLSNALNPKVALFFVTFLPQFLTVGGGSPRAEAGVLAGVFAALYIGWFGLYATVVDRLGRWLRRPRVQSRIELVTGLVLAVVAVRLITA